MAWSKPGDREFLATLPPDAAPLRDMPEPWPEVAWMLEAFGELSASRTSGFGSIGFIPIGEIAAWADANGVEDVATLIRHIRALDAVYVADWVERQKREQDRRQDKRGTDSGATPPG